jgi:hypothetical protein
MATKDIIELAIAFLALIASVVAIVVSARIASTQASQQEALAKDQARQSRNAFILERCQTLSFHLTSWHDALRQVVRNEDVRGLENFRDTLVSFAGTLGNIKEFERGQKYQGPLLPLLAGLQRYSECAQAVEAVRAFESVALDFKEGVVANLSDMITGHGHWPDTRLNSPMDYQQRKEGDLQKIRSAYQHAMYELTALTSHITAP